MRLQKEAHGAMIRRMLSLNVDAATRVQDGFTVLQSFII